jgi:hypothetical protein
MSKVKLLHLLIVLAIIILGSACQKTVILDVGIVKPRLVVNSILDKDSVIRVQLSKSRSMVDSSGSIEKISTATVKVYEDNILMQTLTKGSAGLYSFSLKPKTGKDYRLEVDNTEFGHVQATALIPTPPFLNYATQTTVLTPGSNTQYIKFKIGIKDEGIQPDFYYLRAFIIKKGFLPGANSNFVMSAAIQSDDNVIITDDSMLKGVIFDDAAFIGKNYEMIVYTPYRITKDFNLWFELSSITSDYYKYLVSSIMQNNAGSNPFAEPVVIKSNVQNGTGIFGAQNSVFIQATTF